MRSEKSADYDLFSAGLVHAGIAFAVCASSSAFAGPLFDGPLFDLQPVTAGKEVVEAAAATAAQTAGSATTSSVKQSTSPSPSASSPSQQSSQAAASASAKVAPQNETPRYLERGYRHEWMFSGDVDFVKASTKSKPDEAALTEQGLTMNAQLLYGYFIGELVEPVVEVGYSQSKNKVGEFDGTSRKIQWGAGILFNTPLVDDDKPARLHFAKWVPFGGLLVMSEHTINDGELASTSSSANKYLMTNLVAGVRYMAYANVAVNSSLRLSYEKSSTSAEVDGKSGGERSKTRIQARLLGISLMF